MSYHYSPEEAAECSARTCSDGDPSDTSRSTTTPSASCAPASTTDTYPPPPSSAMSAHSSVTGTPQHIRDWLMSLPPASTASPSASQASAPEPTTTAICGPKPSHPSAWYDRTTACWRTFQASLLADTLEPFSATWPKAGMTLAGEFYPLPKWERRINEIGSGLWPSPKALDRFGIETSPQNHAKYGTGMTQTQAARRSMWPTPMANMDGRKRHGTMQEWAGSWTRPMLADLPAAERGGQLNPTWVELLMGWPAGWTSLNPISMLEYQQWLMGFMGEDYATQTRSGEVLRDLREEAGTEAVQRETGRFEHVQAPEVLRPDLCGGAEGVDQTRVQLEGTQAFEGEVRSVWVQQESASAPHRPGQEEQSAGKYSDAMQVLPQLLARYGKEAWQNGSWENAIPRIATGIPNRVDRLKALGNGQVPAVVRAAWELLTALE